MLVTGTDVGPGAYAAQLRISRLVQGEARRGTGRQGDGWAKGLGDPRDLFWVLTGAGRFGGSVPPPPLQGRAGPPPKSHGAAAAPNRVVAANHRQTDLQPCPAASPVAAGADPRAEAKAEGKTTQAQGRPRFAGCQPPPERIETWRFSLVSRFSLPALAGDGFPVGVVGHDLPRSTCWGLQAPPTGFGRSAFRSRLSHTPFLSRLRTQAPPHLHPHTQGPVQSLPTGPPPTTISVGTLLGSLHLGGPTLSQHKPMSSSGRGGGDASAMAPPAMARAERESGNAWGRCLRVGGVPVGGTSPFPGSQRRRPLGQKCPFGQTAWQGGGVRPLPPLWSTPHRTFPSSAGQNLLHPCVGSAALPF